MPFVTDEIVTAAKLNMATVVSGGYTGDDRTFTNTTFLDLDALTGGAGSMAAVAVTVTTGTSALVVVSGTLGSSADTIAVILAYRISGATTVAASSSRSARVTAGSSGSRLTTCTFQAVHTGLTAGSNTFELQASVSGAATGRLLSPALTVMGIV